MRRFFYLVTLLTCYVTCLLSQTPGSITQRLVCEINSDHSYSLYLPSTYTPDKKWPVLFIYDAQGNGMVGIDVFKPAAEKYGYILIGSYNYRNGPVDKGFEAARVLLEEVTAQYPVDKDRLYTAGMSGGARMATTTAVVTGQIAGVVAIGAAFNFMNEPNANSKFDLVGIAGDKDMNYGEMPFATELTRSLGNYSHFISYDGKHRWCTPKQATEAIGWLELMALKRKKASRTESFVQELTTELMQKADSLEEANNLTQAHDLYQSLSLVLEAPLSSPVESALSQLAASKVFKKQRKQVNRILAKEAKQGRELREGFRQIQLVMASDSIYGWWQKKTQKLRQEQRGAKFLEARNAATRNLGLIGLIAFSNASPHIFRKEWDKALPYFKVTALINPDHADVNYFMAKLYSLAGNQKLSKRHLKKAINAGFQYTDNEKDITDEKLIDPSEFSWLTWRVINATF